MSFACENEPRARGHHNGRFDAMSLDAGNSSNER